MQEDRPLQRKAPGGSPQLSKAGVPGASRSTWRTVLSTSAKVLLTAAAFYLLLTHRIPAPDGTSLSTWQAVSERLPTIDTASFWPAIILAASIKAIGIFCSMTRWHVLLLGQGVRFPFLYLVGTFLIGRFIGTFLPSTVGLDGYKLYDAARVSGRVVEPAAAIAVEKLLGMSGLFVAFLVSFPLGYRMLGDHAALTALVAIPLALAIVAASLALVLFPAPMVWLLEHIPLPRRQRISSYVARISTAAQAYRGRYGLLFGALGLSFLVHFCTAAMYFFTAQAIGAVAPFWHITLASTIQIVATVVSPFTIAGEGVREIVQALLLAKDIGVGASVLSAALGFWAAEALTLVGGFVWLARRRPAPRRGEG